MNYKYKYAISVIIVCHPKYNHLLDRALESLKKQTFHDFETILVLNGYDSEPNLDYTKRLTIIRTEPVNLATACNIAIKQSHGEYIIRLDADDWFHDEILKFEWQVMQRHKAIDVVWCDFYRVVHDIILNVMTHKTLEHACGVLFKREVFDRLDGYDERLDFQESFDFWHRFWKLPNVSGVSVKMPLYFYRKHHQSMSTNTSKRNQARINILMGTKWRI